MSTIKNPKSTGFKRVRYPKLREALITMFRIIASEQVRTPEDFPSYLRTLYVNQEALFRSIFEKGEIARHYRLYLRMFREKGIDPNDGSMRFQQPISTLDNKHLGYLLITQV